MSARLQAGHDQKRKTCLWISPKTCFCLPSISDAHGCGPWLVRGTRCPLVEYAASLRFQTSALPPEEGRRIPLTFRIHKNGGACRDRTDDLKLAKLPLSQLS